MLVLASELGHRPVLSAFVARRDLSGGSSGKREKMKSRPTLDRRGPWRDALGESLVGGHFGTYLHEDRYVSCIF